MEVTHFSSPIVSEYEKIISNSHVATIFSVYFSNIAVNIKSSIKCSVI